MTLDVRLPCQKVGFECVLVLDGWDLLPLRASDRVKLQMLTFTRLLTVTKHICDAVQTLLILTLELLLSSGLTLQACDHILLSCLECI